MKVNELKAARIRCGLTQKEIAKKLGMCEANYNGKENGKTSISVDDINKLADVLNLSTAEIINIFFDGRVKKFA